MRTVGVEEEFLLVDAHHDQLASVASAALRVAAERGADGRVADRCQVSDEVSGALVHEFLEQQLEAYSSPHRSMSSLEAELRSWRATASSVAQAVGARIVASATSPIAGVPLHVQSPRYDRIAERFGILTREQLVCGCHVHVSIDSPEEAVGVLDRIRVWLPVVLALSANSPFWRGQDTGYASYRNQALGHWPVSGLPDVFGSVERYREVVDALVAADVILDEEMLYFDARCCTHYPTVEIRMPDVCLDVRDGVVIAALCRALVDTAAEEWAAGDPAPPTPTALLRLATWHAARWGIDETLLDPLTSRPRPAEDVLRQLLEHAGPALVRNQDDALVARGVDRILARGSGARLQRDVFRETGHLPDVVAALARATTDSQD